ncbi:putative regulation of kinetochore assembly [Lyophyllum shimeji]|uniref:Regulation of kinetochore assembly n=1 Tax=Lyophyllum shimeji TaxID=47721 RepID=A0A9P3PTW1_LYOSH|nr:putative regulation of kinetochore assembly [Lyophyllum shimeji]
MPRTLETNNSSPGKTIKQLPLKLGRKIKQGWQRLSAGHHVTPKHHSALNFENAFPIITSITTSPLFPSADAFDSRPLSPPAFSRTAYSRGSFNKAGDDDSARGSDSASSTESLAYSAQSSHSSSSVDMAEDTAASVVDLAPSAEETPSPQASDPAVEVSGADGSNPTQPADDKPIEVDGSVPAVSQEEAMLSSPPAVYVEPNVPDPFLIDDDASSEDEEDNAPAVSKSRSTITPQDVSLTLPASPLPSDPATIHSAPLASPSINKAVPPHPSDSETDEEEAPDVYLPGLILPTMFLPIPNTDPLSTLLTKYINPPENRPVRDVTGDWQRSDFHTLVMTNSWRALARMARDRLITSDPEDLTLILGLWYLRLAALARLRLFNQTSAECTNLFVVLNGIEPPEARAWVFDRVLPFELEVMHARLKYWAGDHMGYLDALNALLRKCRTKARREKANSTAVSMWKERGARVCLIIASQLIEMKDFRAATRLLEPLCAQGETSTAELRSSIGRIYLQSGEIQAATEQFEIVAADPVARQELKDMNAGLLASAEGDWVRASSILEGIIAKDANNFVAVNNLSVALLSQGKLKEGIDALEAALRASPSSVVVAEPFLYNLSTLYELRSATAAENKRNLLLEVAKWSGDGLRTTCLKMPTT